VFFKWQIGGLEAAAAGIKRIVSHANRWAKIFRAFDANSLSLNNEADREWLLANIDGELLRTERMRSYERDPGMYLPTAGVYELIERNFALLEFFTVNIRNPNTRGAYHRAALELSPLVRSERDWRT
jgi:hypothetical protein